LRVWDLRAQKVHGFLGPFDSGPVSAVISPDSRLVAVRTTNWRLYLGTLATCRLEGDARGLFCPGRVSMPLAFSPDGRSLFAPDECETGEMPTWDVSRLARVGATLRPALGTAAVAWPRKDRIITVGEELIRLWDTNTGKCLVTHQEPDDRILAVAIRPGGKTFATAHANRTVKRWQTETIRSSGPPLPHLDEVRTLAFSRDGRWLATGSADRTARLWDVITGKPVGPPLAHRDSVTGVAFLPEGRQLVTVAGWAVQFWEVPEEWPGEPAQVKRQIEALTGRELDEHGTGQPLLDDVRRRRRQEAGK
jgi:WD40 repeat protein